MYNELFGYFSFTIIPHIYVKQTVKTTSLTERIIIECYYQFFNAIYGKSVQ